MNYFDGCYFDPAYFDAAPCTPSFDVIYVPRVERARQFIEATGSVRAPAADISGRARSKPPFMASGMVTGAIGGISGQGRVTPVRLVRRRAIEDAMLTSEDDPLLN